MRPLERIFVFVASPGDVPEARMCVRSAIDRVNRLVAKRMGFVLEAIGWEDVRPGRAARAQEVINTYVDGAHIFIGILHQRFGTPTGIAESGTEEEFNRMAARWDRENPRPAMWVWFKRPLLESLALTRALAGELPDEVRAGTLHNRGLARQKLGDRAGSIADFASALELNPALDQARQALAAAQQRGQ